MKELFQALVLPGSRLKFSPKAQISFVIALILPYTTIGISVYVSFSKKKFRSKNMFHSRSATSLEPINWSMKMWEVRNISMNNPPCLKPHLNNTFTIDPVFFFVFLWDFSYCEKRYNQKSQNMADVWDPQVLERMDCFSFNTMYLYWAYGCILPTFTTVFLFAVCASKPKRMLKK